MRWRLRLQLTGCPPPFIVHLYLIRRSRRSFGEKRFFEIEVGRDRETSPRFSKVAQITFSLLEGVFVRAVSRTLEINTTKLDEKKTRCRKSRPKKPGKETHLQVTIHGEKFHLSIKPRCQYWMGKDEIGSFCVASRPRGRSRRVDLT